MIWLSDAQLPENKLLMATIAAQQINAVRIAESKILNYLYSFVDSPVTRLTGWKIVVQPNSKVIRKGEQYVAEIFLAAIDTTTNAVVRIKGRKLPVKKGVAVYRAMGSSTGFKQYGGTYDFFNPITGEIIKIPFIQQYEVNE